jgi:Tfp pilus assembly protein FimV
MTTQDPLREAEVYAAYGRTGQAVALLRQALQQQPGREDLRQRLEMLERQAAAEAPRRRALVIVLAALALAVVAFLYWESGLG